jgi:hypothetical protein
MLANTVIEDVVSVHPAGASSASAQVETVAAGETH